ncbi:hypothetical protein [Calothrix sp. UHCC 0171]|uniref:hypothetical protein n=1 Tax=Calothrix sp. UHCC 0171 TaxID=3110245 RepID=UPI002B1F3B60|nr:hypothetical protein [Calothrix sp. UHCC 0171]MEA5570964.1 hypothetical protein [Calothrix sp. UHCC 0171]
MLLGSIFILVSGTTFPESAKAEPEPTLDTKVTSSCVVEKVQNGKLGVTNDSKTLSSTISGGISGIVTIDCTGSAVVAIVQPVQNSGTTTFIDSGDILSATAKNVELDLDTANPGKLSKTLTDSEEDGYFGEVKVDMEARKNSGVISPGTYNFTVTLTVTPQ